jgi:hypothetical protein
MKRHTAIYLKAFGYDECDFIPCEIPTCGKGAVDIHHIECRGLGGKIGKDTPENLQALCREHHIEYGDKKQYKDYLKQIHANKLKQHENI